MFLVLCLLLTNQSGLFQRGIDMPCKNWFMTLAHESNENIFTIDSLLNTQQFTRRTFFAKQFISFHKFLWLHNKITHKFYILLTNVCIKSCITYCIAVVDFVYRVMCYFCYFEKQHGSKNCRKTVLNKTVLLLNT